jgi:hypothetical protein
MIILNNKMNLSHWAEKNGILPRGQIMRNNRAGQTEWTQMSVVYANKFNTIGLISP